MGTSHPRLSNKLWDCGIWLAFPKSNTSRLSTLVWRTNVWLVPTYPRSNLVPYATCGSIFRALSRLISLSLDCLSVTQGTAHTLSRWSLSVREQISKFTLWEAETKQEIKGHFETQESLCDVQSTRCHWYYSDFLKEIFSIYNIKQT